MKANHSIVSKILVLLQLCPILQAYRLILLPATELEGAVMIAERALEQIRSWKFDNEGTLVPITASSGVAGFIPSSVGRRENLVAKADRAMYRAKELGRDQVCFEEE